MAKKTLNQPAPDLSQMNVDDMDKFKSDDKADAATKAPAVKQDKLGGFDFSLLQKNEEDNSIDTLLGKKLDKERYVLAKLVSYPNTKLNACTPTLNGIKYVFPMNELRLVKFFAITHARHSGFVGHADGVENRVMLPNAPVFEVNELPDTFDNMSLDGARDFAAAIYERSGVEIQFASTEDG